MMEISATAKAAAAVVAAIGTISGSAVVIDNRYAPASIVSEIGVIQIFNLVETAQRDGRSDWICRAIDQEIVKLCSKDKDHYFCTDAEALADIKRKAGCSGD